ncbi:MAG: phospholipid carrier-dependent glycosyltransferase [Oscillatoriaceae bacterium SKW80]|nr:phospholipid carrier-dependent glycosyltransferase [Oscillatoriaceae bacterium SKYG93]MCX8121992.1 phospholipid carrier-dependent glycosyltransferase [Oscillatoriaceae bacterium SKW80]MDW8454278.1 phospholipid carrier-dependent glycosyltransferase [Oscillatoriaceae cyanobacterium SKYGB_i_bin93]HIK29142.1 phospholipid carrier-dependent glycosyltransferase [Oscillatoriaceae cyanobacterium M7585_C2015_266]
MNLKFFNSFNKVPWFSLGLAVIFFLAAALRFWGLTRFNALIFDEIYYAKFGVNYLDQVPFFDAHPPLGKYIIAFAIWLSKPFVNQQANGYTGMVLSPFNYRWLNALIGSLLPLVVAGIAYQLSHRQSYALIAAFFVVADGLLLVESRYALINIYLVFFGFLAHWLFLLALSRRECQRGVLLAASGLCLGASAAVKWNGLGFLLGIYLLWMSARGLYLLRRLISGREKNQNLKKPGFIAPLENLTQLNLLHVLFYFAVIPALTYSLIWIPHLQINTDYGFLEVHEKIFNFHKEMKNGAEVHPYCSAWYTWPLTLRPMVYLFEKARNTLEPVPTYPPLPEGVGKVIYDVHAMGNPALWWFSSGAIALLLLVLCERFIVAIAAAITSASRQLIRFPISVQTWLIFYLVVNYAANWLPWIKVTRCTFIYLYMSASIFSFLALAWLVERWLNSYHPFHYAIAITIIFLISLSFVFFLPVYLGLPLSQHEFNIRMWLRSWI